MTPNPENIKKVYSMTWLQKRRGILWLTIVYFSLMLAFIIVWPIAWIFMVWTVLLFGKTPWPKKFDEWCYRILLAPRHALMPGKDDQKSELN